MRKYTRYEVTIDGKTRQVENGGEPFELDKILYVQASKVIGVSYSARWLLKDRHGDGPFPRQIVRKE
jgi:hypothetical protein